MSRGVGTPSRDLTKVVLCSSRMISMQSSTHSSQMKTVGPAMSLRTSCWLFPQKEQYSVFLESPPPTLLIPVSVLPARARPHTVRLAALRNRSVDPFCVRLVRNSHYTLRRRTRCHASGVPTKHPF